VQHSDKAEKTIIGATLAFLMDVQMSVYQKHLRRFALTMALLCLSAANLRAAVIYTYDFPGGPGSGLAANQTNP